MKNIFLLPTDQDLIKDGVQSIYENEEVKSNWIKENHLNYYYKEGIMSNKPKQETLEEFIDKVDTPADFDQFTFDEGIRVGAKWQAERMYSEGEVNEMFNTLKRNSIDNAVTISNVDLFISSWVKQFKEK